MTQDKGTASNVTKQKKEPKAKAKSKSKACQSLI